MAKPHKWKTTVKTVEGDTGGIEGAPLFSDESNGEIAYILVTREDPEEGYLGRISAAATEEDIRKKYGGGTFMIDARMSNGKCIKNGRKVIPIAGDPIFKNEAAEKKWKRERGLIEPEKETPQAPSEKQFGLMEMMLLLDKQAEKARVEAREFSSAREREAAQAHQRQIELIQADSLRREQDLRSQSERIDREAKEERERNREFMATLIKLREDSRPTEAPADASVRLLLSGIQLARDLGTGGPEDQDPIASLVQKLPEILTETRRLVNTEKNGTSKKTDDDNVTFEGELGEKVKKAVKKIQDRGKDPGTILGRAFDVMSGSYSPPKKKESPTETPPKKPLRKVTPAAKSAKTTE